MALRSAPHRAHRFLLALTALVAGASAVQAAAPIFNEVHTIAGPTVAVPQEYTFSVSAAGDYTITLTDLGAALTPSAPLQSVELAVTSSADTLVGAPLVGAGTLTLNSLAVGDYTIHVIGLPGNTPGSGPFGVAVDNASMTSIATFQGVLALPSGALPNGLAVWSDTFTPQAGGNYTVALNDLQLPQSLSQFGLLLIPQGGTTITQILPVAGSPTPNQATVALTAGVTYSIIFYGQASPGSGGLLSATVTPSAGGSPIYGKALAAGTTTAIGSPGLAAGSATFTLTDLKYPAALAQVQGVLLLNGVPMATLSAAGSQALTAVAGTYQVFGAGTAAAAAPGAGSFAVQVTQGGVPAFGAARGVIASGSSLTPYSFDTTVATAGKYALSLTDFRFPVVLDSLGLVAVQGGAALGSPLTSAGDLNITAAAGPLTLLVFAQAATGGGLFGIDTTPLAGGASLFSVTQGVGGVFSARQFSITAAGTYAVTATDLGFPATFANFDTIVTQGTTQLGQIFGGGTFVINATPGNYFINFVAQPTGSNQAGTYALTVGSAPAAPVVSLSTDNSQVASGSTVDIIWSSQNATSCTAGPASGGWSGPQATSGTATSAALTATTTFTLSCSGAGGTTQKSVTVTITAPASGGHKGSADGVLLTLLAVLLACRALQRSLPRTVRSVSRVGRLP